MRIDYENLRTPDHWQRDKIGNRIKLNYGKSQVAVRSIDGDIPVYGTGGLMEYANRHLCEGNSVLLGRKGTLDNPLYLDHPFWPVDTTFYTTDFNGSVKWFYYFTQTLGLSQLSEATGVPSLSRETFYRIEIPFPPVEEQAAIAAILTTVDRAIAQTEALIAKQRRIKAGLLHDLLTRGIDDAGRLRDPATHRFKETAVGLVPVEWEVERFGGHVESSAFGPRFSSALYAEDGSAAMLRTTDLDDDGNIISLSLPRANLDLGGYAHHFLKEGDVVISRSGTIGVTTVFSGYEVPVIPAAFMIRFRMFDTMNPTFVRRLFNSPRGRKLIYGKMAGGVQSNITSTAIADIRIPVPNPEEQRAICRVFDEVNESLAQTRRQLDKLHSLKSGLMHDLLTGWVAVTRLANAVEEGSNAA